MVKAFNAEARDSQHQGCLWLDRLHETSVSARGENENFFHYLLKGSTFLVFALQPSIPEAFGSHRSAPWTPEGLPHLQQTLKIPDPGVGFVSRL